MFRDVGVIVARFQTPDLHPGHHYILNYVRGHHENTLVVLGTSPIPLSQRDPLDYETRAMMVSKAYPDVVIAQIEDCRSDELWSARLDQIVATQFPGKEAILYGSKDCFAGHYSGKYQTEVIPPAPGAETASATDLRNQVGVVGSRDFRAGMIYASKQPFPTSYQVVDVAIIDEAHQTVLLGHKPGDGDKYRFIGGFVDPLDESLELAAKREVGEETSRIETADYKYLGSARINDWRYKSGKHKVMSSFFVAKYIFGHARASDDLDQLIWVPIGDLQEVLITEHMQLAKMLLADRFHPPVGYAGML